MAVISRKADGTIIQPKDAKKGASGDSKQDGK